MPPKRAKTIATAAPTRRSARTTTAASTAASTSASVGKKRARSPEDKVADDGVDEEDDKDDKAPPKKRAKAAKTSKAKPAKSDDDAQEPEDDIITTPETTTKRATRSTGKSKAKGAKAKANDGKDVTMADGDANDEDDAQDDARDDTKAKSPSPPAKMVTVIKRGAAPVDPGSNYVSTHQVYAANGEVWDAMLNQTNVSKNNNKFYVIQLLHPINQAPANNIVMHVRWGRVGENGQSQDKGPWNADGAIRAFKSQFRSKTATAWEQRHSMTAQPGKYAWLERDYSDEEVHESKKKGGKEKGKEKEEEELEPELKAPPEIQTLVQFIFNTSNITAHLAEMNYDANKLPLGKLAKTTILAGFTVLKTLADVISSPSGPAAQDYHGFGPACESLSNQYYSIIPHSFGRNRPIVINTENLLKKELAVLDALGDMQIASKALSNKSPGSGPRIHPIDAHLASLQLRAIEHIKRSTKEFTALEKYVQDTHGATHSYYKVEVQNVFRIERDGEKEQWESAAWLQSEVGKKAERFLLWHGSRSTNFAGILKQGLRIAPPEAPVSGYMFGKGVYFADMMSKSANYCYASLSQNTGLLLLAEVAVAPFHDLIHATYNADVECKAKNKLATKGVGRMQPVGWGDCADILGNDELKGVKMPNGPGAEDLTTGSYLQYNEYIVYDVSQIRLRYLLKIKMQ